MCTYTDNLEMDLKLFLVSLLLKAVNMLLKHCFNSYLQLLQQSFTVLTVTVTM